MLPLLPSRCLQNVTCQSYNQPLHSTLPAVSSDAQRSNLFSRGRHNSTWHPLIHYSPLITAEESLHLTKGIKGMGIEEQTNKPAASLIGGTQDTNKPKLPRLYSNNHGSRKSYHNMKIRKTINNEQMKEKNKSINKSGPLDCFTVISLNPKKNK